MIGTSNESGIFTLATASIVGLAASLLYQHKKLEQIRVDAEKALADERRKARAKLHATAEYKARKAKLILRKREYERSLVDVATFDENDEMTVRRMPARSVPAGCLLIEAPQESAQLQVPKEISGDRFIDNLEKANRDRVNNIRVPENSEVQSQEVVIDMNPKKLERPKDVVFMDFMALYARALKPERK